MLNSCLSTKLQQELWCVKNSRFIHNRNMQISLKFQWICSKQILTDNSSSSPSLCHSHSSSVGSTAPDTTTRLWTTHTRLVYELVWSSFLELHINEQQNIPVLTVFTLYLMFYSKENPIANWGLSNPVIYFAAIARFSAGWLLYEQSRLLWTTLMQKEIYVNWFTGAKLFHSTDRNFNVIQLSPALETARHVKDQSAIRLGGGWI